MDNELKHLLERYNRPTAQKLEVPDLFSLVEEMMNTASDLILEIDDAPSEASQPGQKQLSITLPTIRLSEKMWGKEGTRDREILQNLLGKIIGGGKSVADKIRLLNDFLVAKPEDTTLTSSEVLTYIVFLDTMTNIMLHFNASAAGFTFEGFLSALLEGEQVPASGAEGIQDILDNERNPLSLKLLTGEGPGDVHGSYRDLISHFTPERAAQPKHLDPDPDTGEVKINPKYIGKAGAEGEMKYLIGLKDWREKDMAGDDNKGGWNEGEIKFYEFSFTAETFLKAISTGPKSNHDLLLLPVSLLKKPEEQQEVHPGLDPEQYAQLEKTSRNLIDRVQKQFTPEAFTKFMDTHELVPITSPETGEPVLWAGGKMRGKPRLKVVAAGSEPGASIPTIRTAKQAGADPRYASVAAMGATEDWLSFGQSWKLLKDAYGKGENLDDFWALIGQTKGAVAGKVSKPESAEEELSEAKAKGDGEKAESQFVVASRYYKQQYDERTGVGFLGGIKVGKKVVTQLANSYANILNQKIFDIYAQLEQLSDFLNAYFVAGDKDAALEAARAAGRIEGRTRRYEQEMKEQPVDPELEAAEE